MATRRISSQSKSSLFTGIILGLILGLAIAVAAALYITKAPIPFMDKVTPNIEEILSSGGYGVDETIGIESDPNSGLYGGAINTDSPVFQGREAQIASELGRIAAPIPSPPPSSSEKPESAKSENLNNLIAQLNEPSTKPAQVAQAQPSKSNAYYLQAGAFRSAKDAESIRARILLLGLDANVQEGSYDGGIINRVRVGPFNGVDAMNKARTILGKEKIETSVVRP